MKFLLSIVLSALILLTSSVTTIYAFETEGAPPFGLKVPHSFGDPIHQDITSQGLSFLKPDILKLIVDEHVKIEADQSSPNHFDNCQFAESTQRINERYTVGISFLDPKGSDHAIAAKYFSQIIHAAQDFYSHSNWIEMGRSDLVDSTLGRWQILNGYSMTSHDSPVFVLEKNSESHMGYTISKIGKSVTVLHKDWDARKPALISGTFDAGENKCPPQASIPHGAKVFLRYRAAESLNERDELNKDHTSHAGHAQARALATSQTTHEFCRLVNLVEERWKKEGVDNLYDNWVANKNEAGAACDKITDTGTKISDPESESKNKVAVGQKIKPEKNEKIAKTDTNKITEKQIKKDKILVQKNNTVIKETKKGDTKIIEYENGVIREETGLETRSATDDTIVTRYPNGTVSTWTTPPATTVTTYPDGRLVRSSYNENGDFYTTTRYPDGRSVSVNHDITTVREPDGTSRTTFGDGTVITYPRDGKTYKITEFANGTKISESNDGKITKTTAGAVASNKKISTVGNEIKISKDDVKKLYTIAKLHEATATALSGVNDQQKIILQKATSAANKALTKEQKDKLKPLLKEQDSDKKDIKTIQDYTKKVSNAIKKLAQKQGIKQSEFDKITKIPKDGKPTKTGPINQLKQDATDAKGKLEQAREHQDGLILDAMFLSNILGETDPIREAMTEMTIEGADWIGIEDARTLLANSRDKLTSTEIQELERKVHEHDKLMKQKSEEERARAEQEELEKSKQHVIDMMQQLLELVQKQEQAQTDSILDTIPEPTLRDLFTPSSTTRDKTTQEKSTPKESLAKPDSSKKIEKTGDSDEEIIIRAYSVVTMLSSTTNKPSDIDILKRVKSQLTQQEYRTLIDFLDSRIEEIRNSVPIPLENPAPITDSERAQVLAESANAAVIPPTFFDEQKSQKPSNEKNKPDFEILLKPDSMRLPRGGYGEVDVTVKSLNGWNDKVWLNIPIPIGPIRYPTIVPNIVSPTSGTNAEAAFAVDVSLFSCPGKYRMAVYGMTHDQMPMEISYTYFNLEIIDPGKIFELGTDQKTITIPKGGSKSFSLVVKNLDNQDHAYLIDTNKFKVPSGVTIEHKNTIGSTSPEQTNKGIITIRTSENIKTPLTFTLPLRAQTSLNCDPTPTENTSVIVNIVGNSIDSPSEQILVPGSQPKPEQTKSNTKPTLSLPKQVTQEATGPAGANVAFSTSSQDKEDGSLIPMCSPASGTTFPIGATPVSCVVTDSNNNSVSGTFTVTVRDTTPPAFGPFQPTEGVKDDTGVQVFFDVTATDLVDGNTQVSCNYQSGYKFPPGVTELKCTTSDSRGNQSTKTVQITVTVTESGQ